LLIALALTLTLATATAHAAVIDVSAHTTGGSGTWASPWTGWESYLNGLDSCTPNGTPTNGFAIYFPKGVYQVGTTLAIHQGWNVYGDGIETSVLKTATAFNSDVFYQNCSNSIFSVWTGLRDLSIYYTGNSTSTASAFHDFNGAFIKVDRVRTQNFNYGIIFDGTETATISRSIFDSYESSGIWLRNTVPQFQAPLYNTNAITINDCQFNVANTHTIGITDDGGGGHHFLNNNFEFGDIGIRAVGVGGLVIQGNTFEDHMAEGVRLAKTTIVGDTNVRPTSAFVISGNSFSENGGTQGIYVEEGFDGSITNNVFPVYTSNAIRLGTGSLSPIAQVVIEGNKTDSVNPMIEGAASTLAQNQLRQLAQTVVASSASAGASTFSVSTNYRLVAGTKLFLVNADGSNGEQKVVSSISGSGPYTVTLTANLATAKAANWLIFEY
jgi:hypothetical protein